MWSLYPLVRNCTCSLFSIAILAARGNSARTRAQADGVITGLYFHNPNGRLFAKCVDWLVRHNYAFISVHDVIRHLEQGEGVPRGAVWLSFDDGWRGILTNVIPLAVSRHVPITLFIPSGIIEGDGLFPWLDHQRHAPTRDSITAGEMEELATLPEVTLGSHTVSHRVLPGCSETDAYTELARSRRALESRTGRRVAAFAYPEGKYDGTEDHLLKASGYRLAATVDNAFITRTSNPCFVPRLAVADDIWLPEAICCMLGIWRPAIDPIKKLLSAVRTAIRGRSTLIARPAVH